MNLLLVLIISVVVLFLGYVIYGSWLARQWGIDPKKETPAHSLEDGDDFEPTPPYVVLGHHFSSIAGAGPINGPIQAAIFGWVPVLLWILLGGVFFGAVHDFGTLFTSLRNKGQSLALIVRDYIDNTAKTLFTLFAFLSLVLLVAAFTSIVAGTFAVTGADAAVDDRNMTTASISICFIGAAIVWGILFRGRRAPMDVDIVFGIVVIVICVAFGLIFHPLALNTQAWMWILGAYILAASLAPMWILLQPRDYLSSYLLYAMMLLSIVGIIGAGINGAVTNLDMPAFNGFWVSNAAVDASGTALLNADGSSIINQAAASGYLFPTLFITIACGAISGFHSLVASGTTSKQIDNELHAQPIGYGGMLIECVLAVISVCAVAFVWNQYQAGEFSAPTQVFASGLSGMLSTVLGEASQPVFYQLLILAVSAFCLTTLDTATRLARFMFQELWIPVGKTEATVSGWRAVLANKYVATFVTVGLGLFLGMTGYSIIWPLFGAANQLLAALAMLAVSVWLRNAGHNNKMFYVPMVFMMLVTLASLFFTIRDKFVLFSGGPELLSAQAGGSVGVVVQLAIAAVLFVLAIVLAVKSFKSLMSRA
ncbi:MAG: hypothetical protein IJ125_09210 [Atopobiaceae bacterium]|nr:hypothetical protein [Atopobiaceae bacterium]